MRFLCFIFLYNFIFSFTLENIVVADGYGNEIDFTLINQKDNLEFGRNYFWIETVDGGYDVKYYTEQDIAGYQFNVEGSELKSASGGASEKNNFIIQFAGKTVLGFSFDGKIIPSGRDDLLEFEVE